MVAIVTNPVVRGLRWVASALAVITVLVVFASLHLTTTAADLLFLATMGAVAFGIPAVLTFLLSIWLEEQPEGSQRFKEDYHAAGNEVGRAPLLERIKCYAIAVACVAFAWGLRQVLDPYLLAYLPFPTFFLAVAISGWLGGFGPAMLATALSTVLARYFYMSPLHELAIDNVLNAVSICMFVVVALALAALTAMLRAALQKIHHLTAPAKAGESAPGLKAHNPAKPRLLA